ncbi:MAG: sensor histidine kinase [Ignavibacteriales bacterium]|nr:sensor histidine kinase [Ignavibacteriales bacterium]
MKNKIGKLTPRPYARLLTMIGEQLIKNEKVALVEIIKNSYDADADWVQVRFIDFDESEGDLMPSKESMVEIEDNGDGMTFDVISDSWMNPASPTKFLAKEKGRKFTKRKERVIQGEKGIGRYAVFKLGRSIEIITKSIEKNSPEIVVRNDFSEFDEEMISDRGKKGSPIFLDEIRYDYEVRNDPVEFVEKELDVRGKREKRNHGTIIRIRSVAGDWSIRRIEEIAEDTSKMGYPFSEDEIKQDFIVDFVINNVSVMAEDPKSELERLFEKAPLRVINGRYLSASQKFSFELNGKETDFSIDRLKENKEFRDYFCEKKTLRIKRKPECGSFSFQFYVFDLTSEAPSKYMLDINEKKFVRKHRIYLYRDGIRVYPYGDPSDDWLGIDVLRGTGRAGDYLSNDQTIGYIGITRDGNPYLKDKTNREGLLEIGYSLSDFRVLIQGLIGLLHVEYKKYKSSTRSKQIIRAFQLRDIETHFESLISHLESKGDPKSVSLVRELLKEYEKERKYLLERSEVTEDLAAVGLTVEAASHDLMIMLNKAKKVIDRLISLLDQPTIEKSKLKENLTTLKGQIEFIGYNIEGIQPLFRSSKRGAQNLNVRAVINNVRRYYEDLLMRHDIKFTISQKGDDLVVRTNEAVLLQSFMNLLDNSIYWLNTSDKGAKEIQVTINSKRQRVLFADNGPGVAKENIPYIFEPFFSTKGISGRGLGLYIARQLMERNGFSIDYIDSKGVLNGANFLLSFAPPD